MFGLLNPALTPLKTKIALIAAGAVIVALTAASGICWLLSNKVDGLQVKLGTASANWASAVKTSNDNDIVWSLERANLKSQLEKQEALTKLAQDAQLKENAARAHFENALHIALNTLKETAHADPQADAWSVVPLPDAIVDGMCRSAAAAAGEAQDCGGVERQGGHGPGDAARAVPDHATS